MNLIKKLELALAEEKEAVARAKRLRTLRDEERRAERLRPFCCTRVAALKYLKVWVRGAMSAINVGDLSRLTPVWSIGSYDADGLGVTATHCPLCGTPLPAFQLRASHSHPIENIRCGACCLTCKKDSKDCLCSPLETHWEVQGAPPVHAVVGLIQTEVRGTVPYYLSVSRKNNPEALGLPGGAVEHGETLEEALAREIKEETGLVVKGCHRVLDVLDDDKFRTVFFRVTEWEGEIRTDEPGLVCSVPCYKLVESSPFRNSNEVLFETLGDSELSHPRII